MSGSVKRKRRAKAKGLNGSNLDPIGEVPPQTTDQTSQQMPVAKTGVQSFQLATTAQAPKASQVTVANLATELHVVNRAVNTMIEYLTAQ